MIFQKKVLPKPAYKLAYQPGSRPDILTKLSLDPADLMQVKNPDITVITACFNTGKFLEETIRSVANQTFRNFEHIVIDGGSTDNTLEILKKYPHIRYISESDRGAADAFRKGLKLARGKYILVSYASDGFAVNTWFESCMSVFKQDPEVSAVWGLLQMLSEDGVAGEVGYEKFHRSAAPQKKDFFMLWLLDGGPAIPEVNLCTTKEVMDICYPPANEDTFVYKYLDWAEFNYNFHRHGYLSYNLPEVASFCRVHEGQLSVKLIKAGVKSQHQDYVNKWKGFRRRILLGQEKFVFVDKNNKPLAVSFKPLDFYKAFFARNFSLDYWRYKIVYNFRRMKKIPRKIKEKWQSL